MFGSVRAVRIGWLLPLSGVQLDLDPLGGFFMALTGAVAVAVGLYVIGYARREHLGAVTLAVLPMFVAAMLLVPAAASVTTLLLAWELMAVTSLVLVLAEHTRAQVRAAGIGVRGDDPVRVRGDPGRADGVVGGRRRGPVCRSAPHTAAARAPRSFLLTTAGFGSKAGLVPLHAWLPRAHPEAPSPVSALMSAAMVNLGVYGICRVDLQLLGPGPRWWGLTLMAVGGVSALYGVVQASVATDLKRLLAYSTTENMGLITLALGAATLFAAAGAARTGDDRRSRGHAAPGRARRVQEPRLPGGGVGAGRDRPARPRPARRAGPPDAGDHGPVRGGRARGVWATAGCRVRQRVVAAPVADPRGPRAGHRPGVDDAAGGGRGRTDHGPGGGGDGQGIRDRLPGAAAQPEAAEAHEAPASMLAGMAVAAAACLVLAVAPAVLAPALRRAVAALPAARAVAFTDFGAVVRLPGLPGSIAPGVIAAGVVSRRAGRGRAGAVASAGGAGTRCVAAMGMRRRRSHPADAVHRHVVRRAAATGLRRRAATGHRHRDHPLRRVAVHGWRRSPTARGSPTRSRSASTRR